MRSSVTSIAVCLAVGLILTGGTTVTAAETRDGVFLHVSHGTDEPHRVLMALNMAKLMAADHPVLVYFDVKGIEVVLAGAENITHAHFPSAQEQLAALAKQGVTLMACPGCLKAAGKTADDLAPGVVVADATAFFSFTAGRILTLDY